MLSSLRTPIKYWNWKLKTSPQICTTFFIPIAFLWYVYITSTPYLRTLISHQQCLHSVLRLLLYWVYTVMVKAKDKGKTRTICNPSFCFVDSAVQKAPKFLILSRHEKHDKGSSLFHCFTIGGSRVIILRCSVDDVPTVNGGRISIFEIFSYSLEFFSRLQDLSVDIFNLERRFEGGQINKMKE